MLYILFISYVYNLSISRYLKHSVLDVSPSKVADVILNAGEDDYKPIPEIGIAAQIAMDKLKQTHKTTHPQLTIQFRTECRQYLESMTKKLVERSPTKCACIRQVHRLIIIYKFNLWCQFLLQKCYQVFF